MSLVIPDEFVRLAEALAGTARETTRRISNEPEVEIIVATSGPRLHESALEALSSPLRQTRSDTEPGV